MCGITGIMAFNLVGKFNKIHITNATMCLEKRGPDFQDIFIDEWVGLGHRRLSIIDTSSVANQPMWDESKRFCIVFNGEIFNYQELRHDLEKKGVIFHSQSDTEVLLKLYIHEGEDSLKRLNGFFAFCIYDKIEQSFFVARDRFGIKPLYYLFDEDKFIFASEMKAMLTFGLEKEIDYTSLYTYFHLNYIPAPATIFKNIAKLQPGECIKVSNKKKNIKKWYSIPYAKNEAENNPISYDDAKIRLASLLESAVQRRLVADVPLGGFLSGGIDSSIITGLASRHKKNFHTFSIGFKDEKFFDETEYAKLVAKHFSTDHTIFSLTNSDLYTHVHNILNYIDEPFADSSAINVYILSKETRKYATVALSGDGADEMFAGYNKHEAFYRMINPGMKENLISSMLPLWNTLPQSRNGKISNLARQLVRFAKGSRLSPSERYWQWAGFSDEKNLKNLFSAKCSEKIDEQLYLQRKEAFTKGITKEHSMNDILYADMQLVLPNDMLTKVDLMSMANGLEVRVPFLDFEVVNFAFSIPSRFKIDKSSRKRILKDAFREMLPAELYNRPKKGFEVPLLKWFRNEMRSTIQEDLLSPDFIRSQGVFNPNEVELLMKKLFSASPGDVHAKIWALIVFQTWWKKYMTK